MTKIKAILSKFFDVGSKPNLETFPELPQVVIWLRAILGLAFGAYMGLVAKKGAVGLILGLNVITFIPTIYCKTMLLADVESYGMSLQFGGVTNALALGVLVWIYGYTWRHSDAESKLGHVAAAIRAAARATGGMEEGGAGEDAMVVPEVPVVPLDTEF
jgi:hypothetical protein